jgi:acetyltransferase
MRLVSCHECSDGAGLPFGGRASDHRRVRCCRKSTRQRKPIFAAWIGNNPDINRMFESARIPNYPNEAEAVAAFMHHVRYREVQDQLLATPPSLPAEFEPDLSAACSIVGKAVAQGRRFLDPLKCLRS